jgi:hypothetical protein
MTITFLASYLILCGVIVSESFLIHNMFTIVSQRHRSRERALRATWHGRLAGTNVPDFRASYVNRTGNFTKADLVGQWSVLLFVSPKSVGDSRGYRWLLAATKAKIEATRYFAICSGARRECEELRNANENTVDAVEQHFHVANDDDGEMTRRFGIASLPALVAVDETGCIMKAGQGVFQRSPDAPARLVS